MNALQTAGQGGMIFPPKTKWMQAASFPPCVAGPAYSDREREFTFAK